MKKYNIENFYVGELYLSYENNGIWNKSMEQKYVYNEISYLKSSGAIDFEDGIFKKIISNNDRIFKGVLTIFYKKNDNEYTCILNGNTYTLNGNNFCKNLVPISSLLPKVSYNTQKELTISQALKLFKYLFTTNYSKTAYNNDKYNINEFYIGNLNLVESLRKKDAYSNIKKYYNLPEQKILYKSDAKIVSYSGSYKKDTLTNDEPDFYDYVTMECVFKTLENNSMYNIHNFQIYENGISKKEHMLTVDDGVSYYDYMMPFSQYLDENKIIYKEKEISIPKVLKIYRKTK